MLSWQLYKKNNDFFTNFNKMKAVQTNKTFGHSRKGLAWERLTKTNMHRHIGLLSRRSTANEMLVNHWLWSLNGLSMFFLCFRNDVQDTCLRCPGGHKKQLCPAQTEPPGILSCWSFPAKPPRFAPPDPTRPMCVQFLDPSSCWTNCKEQTFFRWQMAVDVFSISPNETFCALVNFTPV